MRGILSLCIAHHAASGPGLRTNDSEDERPRSVGSNDEIIPKKLPDIVPSTSQFTAI